MKTNLTCLAILLLLSFCSPDPLGLKSPDNQKLDRAIAIKIRDSKRKYAHHATFNAIIAGIDATCKSLWTSVRLSDNSHPTVRMADIYFESWRKNLSRSQPTFAQLKNVESKPELIIAIKTNELKLLEAVLTQEKAQTP